MAAVVEAAATSVAVVVRVTVACQALAPTVVVLAVAETTAVAMTAAPVVVATLAAHVAHAAAMTALGLQAVNSAVHPAVTLHPVVILPSVVSALIHAATTALIRALMHAQSRVLTHVQTLALNHVASTVVRRVMPMPVVVIAAVAKVALSVAHVLKAVDTPAMVVSADPVRQHVHAVNVR